MPPESFRPCQVETYSGARLHERPRRFTWGDQWLTVRQVLDCGAAPDSLYFRVAAADGRVYLLKYRHAADAWEVQLQSRHP